MAKLINVIEIRRVVTGGGKAKAGGLEGAGGRFLGAGNVSCLYQQSSYMLAYICTK